MAFIRLFKTREEKSVSYKDEPRDLRFIGVNTVERTPSNADIGERDFVQVVYKNKPMWALFRCPCSCGTVISLSLQNVHRPYWTLSINKQGRPSLSPSVYQKTGCHSHFWVRDGHISWATFEE